MLLLEDLHWSDRGTLDLLNHLGRNLEGARLLVVGTYRDVEVDRSHPLSAALAELRRSTNFSRVTLRGLGVDDVAKMLSAIAGREVPRQVADQVHRQTEGNPLFVQEVVRYLVEEGVLKREEGGQASHTDSSLAMQIPEGLRDVIGKRLSRLSPETNRVLSVAAVIGREFRLDVLQDVAGVTEEELYAALEEASGRGVIEERRQAGAIGYRFTHAFLRQTLYEEIFTPRRIRTHQQVARAMEARYASRVDEHAAELAEHFAQSTDPEDLGKAVHYGELAAKRAMSVFAYAEAAGQLEAALQAQELLDPDDKREALRAAPGTGRCAPPYAGCLPRRTGPRGGSVPTRVGVRRPCREVPGLPPAARRARPDRCQPLRRHSRIPVVGGTGALAGHAKHRRGGVGAARPCTGQVLRG